MLYTAETVRDAIRTVEGKRVFWLYPEDRLTPAAEDWLRDEGIELQRRAAAPEEFTDLWGGKLSHKPEELTHLTGQLLVPKTHRRIEFRGQLDCLQAQVLLCQCYCPHWRSALEEILGLCKAIMRADVLDEPLGEVQLGGLDGEALRNHSHYPQRYYGQGHFQPDAAHGESLLWLNHLRTVIRRTELLCCHAFEDAEGHLRRKDLVKGLNRMSSYCYILMIREKSSQRGR